MLIRAQRHLRLPVSGPDPGPLNLNATAAERDLTRLVTVPDRGPLRVPAPFRSDDVVDLFLHQLRKHPEPDTDAQRQQPFLRCPDQLAQGFLHALREHDLIMGRLSDRYVALHGGSWTGSDRSARVLHRPLTTGRATPDLPEVLTTLE